MPDTISKCTFVFCNGCDVCALATVGCCLRGPGHFGFETIQHLFVCLRDE